MIRISVFAFLLFFIAVQACCQSKSYSQSEFQSLYNLTGIWKMETKKGALYEQWWKVDGQKLQVKSFKVNHSDTTILESVQVTFADGKIYYTPVVTGQNEEQPVPFQLISNENNRFVFENKEHDYPQRVIYKIVSHDSVHARIEGKLKGKEMSSDFYYSRLK
jgi:hypothetical protein